MTQSEPESAPSASRPISTQPNGVIPIFFVLLANRTGKQSWLYSYLKWFYNTKFLRETKGPLGSTCREACSEESVMLQV